MDDDSAILVAPQGLTHDNPLGGNPAPGWPDENGEDVAFIRALVDALQNQYCVDDTKIFSTGGSYGGIMSNRLGCEMGDVFLAIGPVMGTGPDGWWSGDTNNPTASCDQKYNTASCVGQVAAWITHGTADATVIFCQGERSRDAWVSRNNCDAVPTPSAPDNCVEYSCDPGYPVIWCPTDLGHSSPSYSGTEIWKFFNRF